MEFHVLDAKTVIIQLMVHKSVVLKIYITVSVWVIN